MGKQDKLRAFIKQEASRREFAEKSIELYLSWITRLADFYDVEEPAELTFQQVRSYVEDVLTTRKKLAPQTIRQAIYSYRFYFNTVFSKDYPFDDMTIPRKEREIPEILTEDEVVQLLSHVQSRKFRVGLAILYATGLDIGAMVQLRKSEIDFENRRIFTKRVRPKGAHAIPLGEYLAAEIRRYFDEFKPKTWLFEGKVPGVACSAQMFHKVFRRAVRAAQLRQDIYMRILKYSYVKHLEQQGVPLASILNAMGILSETSLHVYSQIDLQNHPVNKTPIDAIVFGSPDSKIETLPLQRRLLAVADEDERDYLDESIRALQAGVLRAGVILAWTAAMSNVRKRCARHSYHTINALLKKHWAKAPDVSKSEDFALVREQTLLQVAYDLGEFDKNEKDMLMEHLNLRNKCAHPGQYKPQAMKVSAFLEDLMTIVFVEKGQVMDNRGEATK